MRFLSRCALTLLFILLMATTVSSQSLTQVRASAAIAVNPSTNEILWSQNADVQRPIASLTKLMTAVVMLENTPDLTRRVTVVKADVRGANTTYLRAQDNVSLQDLLHLMMIGSDNAAARAIARVTSSSFVSLMNKKAKSLALTQTRYADPSGLLAANVSTAQDISRLLTVVAAEPLLRSMTSRMTYSTQIGRRTVNVKNTNRALLADGTVLAGKTGYIGVAGFCLASLMHGTNSDVIVVVLGAPSSAIRLSTVRTLFTFATQTTQDVINMLPPVLTGLPFDLFKESETCGMQPAGTSQRGIDFIKRHEAFYARAYRDTNGLYAIGYGMHYWKGRKVTRTYPGRVTLSQASVEITKQIPKYEKLVRDVCAPLNQNAFDALVSVAWNLGRVNTRIIAKLESSADLTVADFMSTATVRGRIHKGLSVRRSEEFALFNGDL